MIKYFGENTTCAVAADPNRIKDCKLNKLRDHNRRTKAKRAVEHDVEVQHLEEIDHGLGTHQLGQMPALSPMALWVGMM